MMNKSVENLNPKFFRPRTPREFHPLSRSPMRRRCRMGLKWIAPPRMADSVFDLSTGDQCIDSQRLSTPIENLTVPPFKT
jgi:hypothetical protein